MKALKWLLSTCWIRVIQAVDQCARSGSTPGRRADHETECCQSSRFVLLFSSSISDLLSSREGNDDAACTGIRNITSRLLQLGAGRPHAHYVKNAAVRLIHDLNLRSQETPGTASAALVANTLAYPVLVLFYHAVHTRQKIPGPWSNWQSASKNANHFILRSANSFIYVTPWLQARFSCRSGGMELTSGWNQWWHWIFSFPKLS